MPATPEDVRARLAEAACAARQASAEAERDSRTALDRLKGRPLSERFAALADGAPQLLPEHRRELLHALRERGGEAEPTAARAAGHASAFEVWRGRLRFRIHRHARDGLLILCLLLAIGIAYRRMPVSWVEVRGNRDLAAAWVMPDGRAAGDRLVAGRAYALMPGGGRMAELRDWRPGEGYAAVQVPVDWLQVRLEPGLR